MATENGPEKSFKTVVWICEVLHLVTGLSHVWDGCSPKPVNSALFT